MEAVKAVDILILSNGPGEVTTWVRPVVKALRQQLGNDRQTVRISLVLSPCPNATGNEVAIAQAYPEIDRIQAAAHFFPFLLWGKTAEAWDWRDRGIVVFLGGDQIYPVVIGKRLGYRIVVYAEWETRWHRWVDQFGVMKPPRRLKPSQARKITVVGDLMADVALEQRSRSPSDRNVLPAEHEPALGNDPATVLIGLLPGSKPAKLGQGVPLTLAIAQLIHNARPDTRFVIPVAPTVSLEAIARYADPSQNPIAHYFSTLSTRLVPHPSRPYLETDQGLQIALWQSFPAYELLTQCALCLTTVGANTAELGALAVPMIVLLPRQQLDAMRAWDGLPGILTNLPIVGTAFALLINRLAFWWIERRGTLLAWPNIWAREMIVPELLGMLDPHDAAAIALELLNHPERLQAMSDRLRQARGEPGAAQKLAALVANWVV